MQPEEDSVSVILVDQFLQLIRQSGATRLEARAALAASQALLPALNLSLVNPDERHQGPRVRQSREG